MMKNHLLIYKSILVLAGLCYNGYAEPQVKLYDQMPSERQLLEDLMSSSVNEPEAQVKMPPSEEIQSASSEPEVKMYDKMPTKEQLLADLKPSLEMGTFLLRNKRSSSSSTGTCRSPDFKAKTVGIAIRFKVNSSRMTKDARQFADILGEVLSADELRDCDFEIEGHTDSSGSEAYNKKLSKRRANAVTTYLVNQHSIDPARLKARGYGENRLLSDYSSTSSKQRRVQVKNVGNFK
jgi:outer membrane protein OmpA-like peptidoglycan-associated protein